MLSVWLYAAAAGEQNDYERHKAEKREQTAHALGQQVPERVGEKKINT